MSGYFESILSDSTCKDDVNSMAKYKWVPATKLSKYSETSGPSSSPNYSDLIVFK